MVHFCDANSEFSKEVNPKLQRASDLTRGNSSFFVVDTNTEKDLVKELELEDKTPSVRIFWRGTEGNKYDKIDRADIIDKISYDIAKISWNLHE
eukprot:TRINITY_DN3171_c1_g1_i1.p2 TRINITY_DN3171_c1_g1~~TRINITY_DN3171_c1_g1_i1.p2  ORF type:complete len:94 (-),score=21.18 TRINITY_DN3171_c1_g1_i1:121-402(-)